MKNLSLLLAGLILASPIQTQVKSSVLCFNVN
jgi:hypothetical protein